MSVLSSAERRTGETYMRTAALHGYTILNIPGIYTRFSDNLNLHRPSTIDYTFANAAMFTKVTRWRDVTQRTGSDHIVLIPEIDSEEVELARPAPDWEKIKWRTNKEEPKPDIKTALDGYFGEEWGYVPIENAAEAEGNFEESLRRLIHLARSWALIKRPSWWSKVWWTPELTEKRRIYTSAAQLVRSDRSGVDERRETRNAYRKALLKQKRKYWDDFLANAKENDI